jgi:hypothetical protein
MALSAGLLLMALMNPYAAQGASWCLFEWAGITFCPGEGLGHSIAFVFRGDWHSAVQANVLGPFAIVILLGRIGTLVNQNFIEKQLFNHYDESFPISHSDNSGR